MYSSVFSWPSDAASDVCLCTTFSIYSSTELANGSGNGVWPHPPALSYYWSSSLKARKSPKLRSAKYSTAECISQQTFSLICLMEKWKFLFGILCRRFVWPIHCLHLNLRSHLTMPTCVLAEMKLNCSIFMKTCSVVVICFNCADICACIVIRIATSLLDDQKKSGLKIS